MHINSQEIKVFSSIKESDYKNFYDTMLIELSDNSRDIVKGMLAEIEANYEIYEDVYISELYFVTLHDLIYVQTIDDKHYLNINILYKEDANVETFERIFKALKSRFKSHVTDNYYYIAD
ncbi:MAG: hypothetical protein ACRDCE_07890 [Cetobacterium sp.]|uniref:hypothetical protein n=1 Tax=Cetobacterium sp. TaxID=2071632 RepID=UPI003EE7C792